MPCNETSRPLPIPEGVGCIECPVEAPAATRTMTLEEYGAMFLNKPVDLPPKGLPTKNILAAKVNANLLEIAMEAREWLISQGQNDEATRARIARVERAISDAQGVK